MSHTPKVSGSLIALDDQKPAISQPAEAPSTLKKAATEGKSILASKEVPGKRGIGNPNLDIGEYHEFHQTEKNNYFKYMEYLAHM